jgi:predicted PurR-regulated permease PerM
LTNVFIKHWRLVALVLGIIIFIWVVYLLRTFLLPFAIGLVLAYLFMPLVTWLETRLPPRSRWPDFKRIVSVLIVFLLLLCLVGGFLYVLVSTVIDASMRLVEGAPYIFGRSLSLVQDWFEGVLENLPVSVQEEIRQDVLQIGVSIGQSIRGALLGSITSIPDTLSVIFGFAILPFFLFYILKDLEKLKKRLSSGLPPAVARHGRNVVDIIENVLGRYIRSQLMLGFIVAYFSFIGLVLLKVPFPLALSLIAGVGEVIPTLGPWIAGAVAVLVTLAMAPDKAIWVAVLYVVIQLLENNLLVPKIQSSYLRIHPAVMIFLLVLGAYVAGIWGIILIGPLTATLVEIFKYIRDWYSSREQPRLPEL